MPCTSCQATNTKRFGKDRHGTQRYRCLSCGKTFLEPKDKLLGSMYLEEEKALMCLNLLVEGCSVRSIERITGVHRDTVIDLLLTVGKKCEQLLDEKVQGRSVQDVQVDEVWAFIQMKEKTKRGQQRTDDTIGDAYTFIALDRDTKLILCWHLGRRTVKDTEIFVDKLGRATSARFQLTSDGFSAYAEAISYGLGT